MRPLIVAAVLGVAILFTPPPTATVAPTCAVSVPELRLFVTGTNCVARIADHAGPCLLVDFADNGRWFWLEVDARLAGRLDRLRFWVPPGVWRSHFFERQAPAGNVLFRVPVPLFSSPTVLHFRAVYSDRG